MSKQRTQGYTLVELLIYIAIFASLSLVVVNSFLVVMKSFKVTTTNRNLLESGSIGIERMTREIRQATSVDVGNSTLGSSPGVLQINTTDSGGNPKTVKFVVASGALNFYENGTLTGNLLGQNISVTSLIFRRISTTNGEAVKIELTLQNTLSTSIVSANFYDTIILRGGY